MNRWKKLYDRALEIGQKKLAEGSEDGRVKGPRIGTGGGFSGIFLWDTAFSIFWMRYHQDIFPCTRSLDNFYRLQDEEGCIHREYEKDGVPCWPRNHPITFAPPLLAWAELGLYEISGDVERLRQVYPSLRNHYEWCQQSWQKPNGLYFGDGLGSGMDNLPRYPRDFAGSDKAIQLDRTQMPPKMKDANVEKWYGVAKWGSQWNRQGSFIDLSSQVAFNAMNLSRICEIIGHEDLGRWEGEYSDMKELVNDKCWSQEHGFFFDLDEDDHHIVRYHIGGFWPLIAKICPAEQLGSYLSHLRDEKKFNRPFPVPSLAADDPDYDPGGSYWLGSSWPCTTYMILKGLDVYGERELAKELAVKYLESLNQVFKKTGTIWENNSPEAIEAGCNSGPDFCGWSGLGPVAVVREFLSD